MIFQTITDKSRIEADICIIGAGAAGLLVAQELIGTNLRVVLLESGQETRAQVPDPLYHFVSDGAPISLRSRARAFGGTTTTWGGRWKPLDRIDFERREWIPRSGWPISFDILLPYYHRASEIVDTAYPYEHPALVAMPFDAARAESIEPTSVTFLKKEMRNWGTLFKTALENSPAMSVYLGVHITRLEKEGAHIVRVHGASADGRIVNVEASCFVLAAGGIESPRLMLLSDVGNEHDQVGRYYMDHPKNRAGTLSGHTPIDLSNSAFDDVEGGARFGLRIRDEVQRRHHLLNPHILLESIPHTSRIVRAFQKLTGLSRRRSKIVALRNYLEQPPLPDNRVTLSTERDPFGNPYASIQWSTGKEEVATLRKFHELLAADLRLLEIGNITSPLSQNEEVKMQDASHHMGTTRMGNDPTNSVVDVNCRVHSVGNLFIAGSSVFPTGGSAGPTATIAALAIRLADHLKQLPR